MMKHCYYPTLERQVVFRLLHTHPVQCDLIPNADVTPQKEKFEEVFFRIHMNIVLNHKTFISGLCISDITKIVIIPENLC